MFTSVAARAAPIGQSRLLLSELVSRGKFANFLFVEIMSKVNKTNGSDVESDNVSADHRFVINLTFKLSNLHQESRISTNASETSTNRSKGGGRKKKMKISNINKPVKSLYRLNCFVVEENAKQIFAVQFNHVSTNLVQNSLQLIPAFLKFVKDRQIFATASGYRLSIYECVDPKEQDDENEDQEEDDDFCGIKLLRAYDE